MMKIANLLLLSSGWHPRNLFRSSELGAILEPLDLAAVYQESTGLTAGAFGSPAGIVFDARYNPVRGAQMVTNGDLSSGTTDGFTAGDPQSILSVVDGELRIANDDPTGASAIATGVAAVVGRYYELTYTLSAAPLDSVVCRLLFGGYDTGDTVTVGTYRRIIKASTTSGLILSNSSSTTIGYFSEWDNISIVELQGSHAVQETAGSRPTLAVGGKVDYDGVDDSLVITFPSSLGTDCTVAWAIQGTGTSILTGQTITTTFTDSTDNCGLVIINRALTSVETQRLTRYLNRKAGV